MSLRYLKYQSLLFYIHHDDKPRQMSECPTINVANDLIFLVLGKISIKNSLCHAFNRLSYHKILMLTWSCLQVGPLRKDSTARAIQNLSVDVSSASFIADKIFDNKPELKKLN